MSKSIPREINTLFGPIVVEAKDNDILKITVKDPTSFTKIAGDKFARENKLFDEVIKNTNALHFLNNRTVYTAARKKMLEDIVDSAQDKIAGSAKEYLNRGYSAKESFKLAFAENKRETESQLKVVESMLGLPNNFTKK